jgi:hypothetical protein
MAALFYALAEAFPDVEDRARVLRESVSPAGSWVSNEIHKVPKWNDSLQRNTFSVIVPADEFRLSEWLDHAISASANGAGSIIWREAMLIRHFGADYPKSFEESERFFAETPKSVLAALAQEVVTAPLIEAGIDTTNLQQGSFWTGNSKRKVPGRISFATPRELARLVFRIEQGQLVDSWSSLQMKKYMYMTKRRYRHRRRPLQLVRRRPARRRSDAPRPDWPSMRQAGRYRQALAITFLYQHAMALRKREGQASRNDVRGGRLGVRSHAGFRSSVCQSSPGSVAAGSGRSGRAGCVSPRMSRTRSCACSRCRFWM